MIGSVLVVVAVAVAGGPAAGTAQAAPGPATVLAPGCTLSAAGRPTGNCFPAASGDATTPLACVGAGVPLVDDRCPEWSLYHDSTSSDRAGAGLDSADVVAVVDDTVFTVGYTDEDPGPGYDTDLEIVFANVWNGEERWTLRVPGTTPLDQLLPIGIEPGPGGRIYVLAWGSTDAFSSGDCTLVTLAIDARTAGILWRATEGGIGEGCLRPRRLAVDPGGDRVYVTGDVPAPGAGLTIAYSADEGDRLWSATYDGAGDGSATTTAVVPSPDGSRVYAAAVGGGDPDDQYLAGKWTLLGYDAATGSLELETHVDIRGNTPAGLAVSSDGGTAFLVGGGLPTPATPLFDIATYAFDTSTGELRWSAAYEGPRGAIKSSFDSVWSYDPIAVAPDGSRVYVAGYSTSLSGVNLSYDMVTLAYDAASGEQDWAARYMSESESNWLPSIAVHPDGSTVYTTGESRYAATHEAARITSIAYETTEGTQAWVARHTDGYTFFGGSELAPDGSHLFVAGSTAEPTTGTRDYDVVTLAYET